MKKMQLGMSLILIFSALTLMLTTPVYAAPTAGIIAASEKLLATSNSAARDRYESDADFVANDNSELVWVASNLRTDTNWMNSIGQWHNVAQTAPYFTGEREFDFVRFLSDYDAEDIDIVIKRIEEKEALAYILSFVKDEVQYQLVSTFQRTGYGFSFGAVGLDGMVYSAMTEVDYWYSLGDDKKMLQAFERAAKQGHVVNSEEGFFTSDEIFNDFILVMISNPRMVYPEDQKGEMIKKLCPFDGLMPHFLNGGTSLTGLSAKHTTIATFGSDWGEGFYDKSDAVRTLDGVDLYENMGN